MNNYKNMAQQVLEVELALARGDFESAKLSGSVVGEFDDNYWNYKGASLLFHQIDINVVKSSYKPGPVLIGDSGKIARCFAISQIRMRLSQECVVSRINGFRCLEVVVRERKCEWNNLNRNILNYAVKRIMDNRSHATAYNRAGAITAFIDYLNRVHANINHEEVRFCVSHLVWRHRVTNPIRRGIDPTSKEFSARRQKLFESELHIALATAHRMIQKDPTLEPCPGYDSLRLQSILFCLCTGMRIGELCALPLNALETDTDTGIDFIRIAVEKGSGAKATPIPNIWEQAVRDAYVYLVETCAAPRKRAAEIEKSGFTFVNDGLSEVRKRHPLTKAQVAQLAVMDFDGSKYYLVSEFVAAFDFSKKEFTFGGRFFDALIEVPRMVAASMASWLDERFNSWDWVNFATWSPREGGHWRLSVVDIGKYSGASKASVIKAYWYVHELRNFLQIMRFAGVFDCSVDDLFIDKESLKFQWRELRSKMLSRRGGGQCSFVKVDIVKSMLGKQYAKWLEVHFKEIIDPEGGENEVLYEGVEIRDGVPSRLSEHLIVVWENQFNGYSGRGILPRPILRSDYYNYLCSNSTKKTVFQRLSILDNEGIPFSITVHSIRRWLTTVILKSGPSQAAVDLWMGRELGQSRAYDYRTASERAEFVRSCYLELNKVPNDFIGRQVLRWRKDEISEEQIAFLIMEKLKAVHFTPWGSCSKDLYVSPCTKGLACLRGFGTNSMCPSFHIDTNDIVAMQEIVKLRNLYGVMYRAIVPNADELGHIIKAELNTTEPLDQHITFIIDMVRGCTQALSEYERAGVNID